MKPTHPRRAGWRYGLKALMCVAVVAGFAHCRKKSDEASLPPPAEKTRPSATARSVSNGSPPEVSADLSVDDLVAIYERDGAAAALNAAKALQGKQRETQVSFMLSYLARIDPEFVARELLDAGLGIYHHGFVVDAVLNEWKDGKKAFEWADTRLTGDLRMRSMARALGILVRTDPQAALAHLATLPASNSRGQAICDLFTSWSAFDPQAALKQAALLSPDEVEPTIGYVVSSWARTHPEDAAAWVASREPLSAFHVRDVFLAWPVETRANAEAWLDSLPDSPAKTEAKTQIDQAVANTSTIVCGFATAPDESWKSKSASEMKPEDLRNWAYQDKAGARRFLEQSPDNPALSDMVISVAACMASDESPQAVFDWALKLSPGLQADALRLAVVSWVGKDPAAAAEKILSLPAERREPLTRAIAENWTRQDPEKASAWVATSAEPNQAALVVQVLEQWTNQDPEKAYRWLGTLPAGTARDEGISYMIRREASHDPELLVPWLDLISDPKLRAQREKDLESQQAH